MAGFKPGDVGHLAEHDRIKGELAGRLSDAQLNATFVTVLGRPGGGDDAPSINAQLAALGAAGGGKATGLSGAVYKIGSVLLVPSGVTLSMYGCTIEKIVGSTGNMVANGATVETATDAAAMTSAGSAVVVTTLPGVVGQTVIIGGAGGTVAAPGALVGDVIAVGGGTLTLSKAATAGLTGRAALYTRDTNVRVEGGYWDRGDRATSGAPYATPGKTNVGTHNALFRHVDGLDVVDMIHNNATTGSYSVSIADCTGFKAEDIRGKSESNMVTVNGPASNGYLRRIRGTVGNGVMGEDIVGIQCRDYDSVEDCIGDITNVEVDVHLTDSNGVCLIAGDGTTLSQITVGPVSGASRTVAVRLPNDTSHASTQGGICKGIKLKDITATPSSTAQVILAATGMEDVTIDGQVFDTTNNAVTSVISQSGSIQTLKTSHVTARHMPAGCALVRCAGFIGAHKVSSYDIAFSEATQSAINLEAGGTINALQMTEGVVADSVGAQLIYAPSGDSQLPQVQISNLVGSGLEWFADIATTTEMHLDGVALSATRGNFANLRATANLNLHVGNFRTDRAVIATTAGYLLRANGLLFPVDIDILNNNQQGDVVNNTNAAKGCGLGPVVFSTTAPVAYKWVNLATQTTT